MSRRGEIGRWWGRRKDNQRHSLEKWRAFSKISQFYSPTASYNFTASVPASNVGFHFILSSRKSAVKALDVLAAARQNLLESVSMDTSHPCLPHLPFASCLYGHDVCAAASRYETWTGSQFEEQLGVIFYVKRYLCCASFNINFSKGCMRFRLKCAASAHSSHPRRSSFLFLNHETVSLFIRWHQLLQF